MSKEVKKERADDGGGQIPRGIPAVCLICLDLVRDKLRSDWAKCQRCHRAETTLIPTDISLRTNREEPNSTADTHQMKLILKQIYLVTDCTTGLFI